MVDSRTDRRHASPHTTRSIRTYSTIGTLATVVAALVVSLVATAAPASATTKTVRLTVDGVTSSVSTNADTVHQLLTEESVPFDTTDLVSPDLGSNLSNGMAVSWRPATRVLVERADGVRAFRVVGTTVAQARDELGLPRAPSAKYSRFETRRYQITKFYTQSGRPMTSTDALYDDVRAVVHQVRIAFPERQQRLEHRVIKDRSPLVRAGSTRVFKRGHDGRRAVVFRSRFVDGKLQTRTVVKADMIRKPQKRVVRIGTGPNWTGLANCESGGNPNAVNPAGFYGLYQFSLSTWHGVGGHGSPTNYGYWEQTKRAWILYKRSGSSPWPVCGRHL
jgi:uncharacterized protein YabE (DUF348 family)